MKTAFALVLLLGIAGRQDPPRFAWPEGECDVIHGIGCVPKAVACSACGKAGGTSEFKLCAGCARTEGRCVACAKRKKVHRMAGTVEVAAGASRFLAATDLFLSDIAGLPESDPKPPIACKGPVVYRVTAFAGGKEPELKAAYLRFRKIDAAGGPDGKYEAAIRSRSIVVDSWMPSDPALTLRVTCSFKEGAPEAPWFVLREAGAAGDPGLEVARVRMITTRGELEVPGVGLERGFVLELVAGNGFVKKTSPSLILKDGAWKFGDQPVQPPLQWQP